MLRARSTAVYLRRTDAFWRLWVARDRFDYGELPAEVVDLFLQSYCYRHHYLHQPGYDVFDFLDRAAADGYTGVSINMNGPNYRQLSGTSPDTPEVESQHRAPDSGQSLCPLVHGLGVHRPPELRMRVQDDRDRGAAYR